MGLINIFSYSYFLVVVRNFAIVFVTSVYPVIRCQHFEISR